MSANTLSALQRAEIGAHCAALSARRGPHVVCAVAGASAAYGRCSGWFALACAAVLLVVDFGLGSHGWSSAIWHLSADYRLARTLILLLTGYAAAVTLFNRWAALARLIVPPAIAAAEVERASGHVLSALLSARARREGTLLIYASLREGRVLVRSTPEAIQAFGQGPIDDAAHALQSRLTREPLKTALEAALEALDPAYAAPAVPQPRPVSERERGEVLCFYPYP